MQVKMRPPPNLAGSVRLWRSAGATLPLFPGPGWGAGGSTALSDQFPPPAPDMAFHEGVQKQGA